MEKPLPGKASTSYSDPEADYVWPVLGAEGIEAGSLSLRNSDSTIYATLSLKPGFSASQADLYCGAAPPPGNISPEQFGEHQSFSPAADSISFELPLAGYSAGDALFVSARLVLPNSQELWAGTGAAGAGFTHSGDIPSLDSMSYAGPSLPTGISGSSIPGQTTETGSFDYDPPSSSVPYISARVMPVFSPVTDWQSYKAYSTLSQGTWRIEFESTGWCPFAAQDQFTGWCVDRAHMMYTAIPYSVQVYSCYDPELPSFAQCANYDLISYLITKRNNSHLAPYNVDWDSDLVSEQFQNAVWYFMGGGSLPNAGSLARKFVEDAVAHGEGFVPAAGEFYAAILYPDTSTNDTMKRAQEVVIEVEENGTVL